MEIHAPPMNLIGPELVRDLVSLIEQAEADGSVRVLVFRSGDPDYFIFCQAALSPESQRRSEKAMKRGFQKRDAELDLGRWLGDLAGQ